MNRLRTVAALYLVALAGCSVGGGTTPEPRYYLLEAPIDAAPPVSELPLTIAVGPVSVADYLDQPRIVTRVAGNEVELHEYRRWATPLARGVPQALRDALAGAMPQAQVFVFPSNAGRSFDVRVVAAISRLDGQPGGRVVLDAEWQALDQNGEVDTEARVSLSSNADGDDIAHYVRAAGALINSLAAQIATGLVGREQRTLDASAD